MPFLIEMQRLKAIKTKMLLERSTGNSSNRVGG